MIRIAVAASGKEETSGVADRFARAPFFILADAEGKVIEAMENDAGAEQHGAASKALMTLSQKSVTVLLVPRMGPNALGFLKQANMDAFCAEGLTVREALDRYKSSSLEKINQ
ncbi:MAG: dinitrogenase iron-molybdenum cofactor biosynthesis protein [Synergistales bacterium]|nr:dinitrogenase iron-molybdenum cofactor biosynthesis protein [Synergistales bacterium]